MCILYNHVQLVNNICNVCRLLVLDVDKYVHLNCALWSSEVYETVSGALMNVEVALKRGSGVECAMCCKRGATLGCFKPRCTTNYHVACAKNTLTSSSSRTR